MSVPLYVDYLPLKRSRSFASMIGFIDSARAAFIKKSLDTSPEDFTAFVIEKLFQIVHDVNGRLPKGYY